MACLTIPHNKSSKLLISSDSLKKSISSGSELLREVGGFLDEIGVGKREGLFNNSFSKSFG